MSLPGVQGVTCAGAQLDTPWKLDEDLSKDGRQVASDGEP